MIVIYTQDGTYIRKDADAALPVLKSVYGDKLGTEAYTSLKRAPEGASFRRNGGPLVRVISKQDAELVRAKETDIGMLQ